MRIVAALSGGVDSAVAAALLAEQGHEVVGVHLRTGVEAEGQGAAPGRSCCGADDARDARSVATALGLPFYVVDVREAFASAVVAPFVAAYAAGLTPNPCVDCNRAVKLGRLLEVARGLSASAVGTGHYARREEGPGGRLRLLCARDARKDQSYVLYRLTQEQLSAARFPLGELTKDEVREEARRHSLPVADKPDSQELCFVPEGDVRGWLRRHAPSGPGPFVDEAGREVGRHEGALGFTRGQRRGLPALGEPRYVTHVDPSQGRVHVAPRAALWESELRTGPLHWVDQAAPGPGARFAVEVKVRSTGARTPAELTVLADGGARVLPAEPLFAAAPGQALVAWRDGAVLCGGPLARGPGPGTEPVPV